MTKTTTEAKIEQLINEAYPAYVRMLEMRKFLLEILLGRRVEFGTVTELLGISAQSHHFNWIVVRGIDWRESRGFYISCHSCLEEEAETDKPTSEELDAVIAKLREYGNGMSYVELLVRITNVAKNDTSPVFYCHETPLTIDLIDLDIGVRNILATLYSNQIVAN